MRTPSRLAIVLLPVLLTLRFSAVFAGPLPIVYYTFDEGSGGTVANLGTRNDVSGVIQGALVWTNGAPRSATPAGGLAFDGVNANFLEIGLSTAQLGFNDATNPATTPTDYTCSAWCWLTTTTPASAGDNMVFGSEGTAGAEWLHNGFRNAGVHQGHYGNDTTAGTVAGRTWVHVAWRYSGGVQELYLNGNRVGGPAPRGPVKVVSPAYIGRASTSRSYNGIVDDVAIYPSALKVSQIRFLANGGSPLLLPDDTLPDGEYYTAPLGPSGTWNLYRVVGRRAGVAATWHQAHLAAVATVDPSGLSTNFGHLVSVTSDRERSWITTILEGNTSWIGLTDADEFGGTEAGSNKSAGWVWAGTNEPFVYQSWNPVEPNNAGASGEDAVEMPASGLWNDNLSGIPSTGQTNAAPTRVYVVEWETGSPTPVLSAIPAVPVLPATLPGPEGVDGGFGALETRKAGTTLGSLANALGLIADPGATATTGRVPVVNFLDVQGQGAGGYFGFNRDFLSNTAADDNHFAAVYKAFVSIPTAGTYTFGVRSDDGFALRIRGAEFTTITSPANASFIDPADPSTICMTGPTGDANTHAQVFLNAGVYALELVYFEIAGGGQVELYAAPGAFLNATDTPTWRLVGQRPPGPVVTPGMVDLGGGRAWNVTSSRPNGAAIGGPDYLTSALQEVTTDIFTNNTWAVLNFSDPQTAATAGAIAGDVPFDNNTPAADDQFAIRATGKLVMPAGGGTLRLGFQSDDGAQLRVIGRNWDRIVFSQPTGSYVGQINGDRMFYNFPTGNSRTIGEITLPEGEHDLEFIFWENGGGAYAEVFFENSHHPLPGNPVLSSGLLGPGAASSTPDMGGLLTANEPDLVIANPSYDAQDGSFALTWPSLPGTRYDVLWSTDYVNWAPAASGVLSTGFTTQLVLPDTFGSPFAVFQVRRNRP